MIAPYYLLKRDGISTRDFPRDRTFGGIRLYANNFTVQGVKVKRCKPLLNHVFSLLAMLEPAASDICPFVSRRDDILVADLSFIPEKYRLDVPRAESILNHTLTRWLNTVKEA